MAIWLERIDLLDVFHNEDLTFEQKRDAIVARIKVSAWYRHSSFEFHLVISSLSNTTTPEDFDVVWDAVYDYADVDRVWIAIFASAPATAQKWAEALRQRDEAVALLVDVEKYNHDFISPGWMARRNVFLATLERRAPYGVATDAAVAQAVAEGRMI